MTAPDPEAVRAALGTVVDPEIGLDIVTLGLVYDVRVEEGAVAVTMTLTAPGCPLEAAIREGVRAAVGRVPGVDAVDVCIVQDPPWTPAMIDPGALRGL